MSWKFKPRLEARVIAVAVAAAAVPFASIAVADMLDPSRPTFLVVGPPQGASPAERVDSQRTGRTRQPLPTPGSEVWSRHVTGGIERSPVVDGEGNIIVALSVPEVEKLSASGKELWRTRVGVGTAVQPPVLTSRGTAVLLTSNGFAVGVSPSGTIRFSTPLGARGRDLDAVPAALRDGGVAVGAGRMLLEIDGDGVVRARATIEERVSGALIAGPEATLVTTDTGSVYSWHPPGSPRKLGTFGGVPRRGAALVDPRTLVAVVDGRRVVALDLPTGVARVRSGGIATASFIDGPAAVGASGIVYAATQLGLLVGIDAADNAKVQIAIDKAPPIPDAGASGPNAALASMMGMVELRPSPPVLVDPDGRVAFLRANGRLGVVGTDGKVGVTSERVCSAPIALIPAGEKRMLVACRDGGLFVFGS